MKKGVFLKTNIHEGGIQSGDKLFNFSQVKVSYGETGICFFMMQFYELFIFQQGDFYAKGGSIYD